MPPGSAADEENTGEQRALPLPSSAPFPESRKEMSETLTARTVRGMKWSYLSTIVHSVLQIGFSATLARLLAPAAFGLVAMAGVVLSFGSYFARMGIGSALVQKETLSREEVHAAFLLSTGLGTIFCAAMWLSAPAAALLFDQAGLIPVVRALSLSFFITGIDTSAASLLRRRLDFRSLAFISIASYIFGYGMVGVPMAYTGYGVWSLVAATLSQKLLHGTLVHATVRHGLTLVRSWKRYTYFFSFGGRVSIISFLEFIGSTLDTMTIGRYIGASPLGLYNRAHMLAFMPMMKLGSGLSKVLLPSLSRIQSDISRLRRTYVSAIGVLGALIVPTCVSVSIVADDVVLVLLGSQWTGAIPVLRLLAFAVAFALLTHVAAVTCEATARLNIKIQIQVVHISLQVFFFWLLFDYGLTGIATGLLIAEAVRHLIYAVVVRRALKISFRGQIRAYGAALLNALVIGSAMYGLSLVTDAADIPRVVRFALDLGTGAVLLGALILFSPLSNVREDVARTLSRLEQGPVTTRLLRLLQHSSR